MRSKCEDKHNSMNLKCLFKWIYTKGFQYNLFMLEETDYDDDDAIKDPVSALKRQKYKTWLYVVLLSGKYTILYDRYDLLKINLLSSLSLR